jgi:hypothetical protein
MCRSAALAYRVSGPHSPTAPGYAPRSLRRLDACARPPNQSQAPNDSPERRSDARTHRCRTALRPPSRASRASTNHGDQRACGCRKRRCCEYGSSRSAPGDRSRHSTSHQARSTKAWVSTVWHLSTCHEQVFRGFSRVGGPQLPVSTPSAGLLGGECRVGGGDLQPNPTRRHHRLLRTGGVDTCGGGGAAPRSAIIPRFISAIDSAFSDVGQVIQTSLSSDGLGRRPACRSACRLSVTLRG